MSDDDVAGAIQLFRAFGVNPTGLSKEELRHAWREIARVCHPDHGGDATQMTELNVAYQVLTKVLHLRVKAEPEPVAEAGREQPSPTPEAKPSRYTPPPPPKDGDRRGAGEDWLSSGVEGRFTPVGGRIRKEDYTDRNYIRKTIHERSRGERTSFHVQAFDGDYYTGLLLSGSPDLVPEMIRAVAELHRAERRRPAKAVLVRETLSGQHRAWTLHILGERAVEIPLSPDQVSVNEPAFLQKLNRIINSVTATT